MKCKNCKYLWSYDRLTGLVVCGVDHDCIDICVADDDNMECDLYVDDSNDDTAKSA